jgi:hypothetical protein
VNKNLVKIFGLEPNQLMHDADMNIRHAAHPAAYVPTRMHP